MPKSKSKAKTSQEKMQGEVVTGHSSSNSSSQTHLKVRGQQLKHWGRNRAHSPEFKPETAPVDAAAAAGGISEEAAVSFALEKQARGEAWLR
jgi:hypothetical protein